MALLFLVYAKLTGEQRAADPCTWRCCVLGVFAVFHFGCAIAPVVLQAPRCIACWPKRCASKFFLRAAQARTGWSAPTELINLTGIDQFCRLQLDRQPAEERRGARRRSDAGANATQ